MKKVIAFTLALLILLSVSACGRKSREALLKGAAEVDLQTLITQVQTDPAAPETYLDKTVKVSGYVEYVFIADPADDGNAYISNFATIIPIYDASAPRLARDFRVYLDEEELKGLTPGKLITAVGVLNTVEREEVRLTNAYIIEE